MTSVAEIQQAILELPENDYEELRRWLDELDWERWDRQIDDDEESGRVDRLLPSSQDMMPDFFTPASHFLLDDLLTDVFEYDGVASAGPQSPRSETPIGSVGPIGPVVHRITGRFRRLFGDLSPQIQRAGRESFDLLKSDPRGLAGKPLAGFCTTPSRRITVVYGVIVYAIRFKNPSLHR